MKKLTLLILLLSLGIYGQARFPEGVRISGGQPTVTSTSFLTATDATGLQTKIDPVNLPLPFTGADNSAGAVQGFALTDNGNGTVDIASGIAYLRATNNQYAPLLKFAIPAVANLALTDNANNFILVDYNGGVPALTVTTNSATINTETNSIALVVSRVGNTLDYLSLVGQNVDANAKLRVRFLNQEGIRRLNGAAIGFSGRNLTLSAGVLASGLIRINTLAFNTGGTDTFTQVYNNGAVWARTTGQTQVNNTQYNNAGTLTNLAVGDYRTDYIYLLPNNPSKLYLVLGTTSYNNITSARTATPPASLPSELQALGVLVGRSIIQRLATNISEVSSAFDVVFPNAPVPEHNALAGLQGGAASDYQHLTTTQLNGISQKNTIAQIRAFTGTLTNSLFITTDLGQEGSWYYDPSDTTTADNTGTVLVTADGKRIKRIIGKDIYVDWFGAVGNGVTNDSPAIQAAQIVAESLGVNIIFSPKTYLINNTITFTKGIVWRGTNRGSSNFTCIRRGANVVGISIVGASILASGTHISTPEFIDMRFGQGESRNYTANFMEIKAVSFLRIKNCRFDAIKGRSIYALELFDSLISDTYFGQNGDPVNLLPVIELRSGADGYEYTNDIHFNNCIIESSYYTSLKTTGNNTNTIYFTDCKFESGSTNLFTVLDFTNSNVVEFNTTVVSSRGNGTTVIPELIKFSGCDLVDLNAYAAMGGSIGVGGNSPLTRVVTFDNCRTVKTNVLFAEGYKDIIDSELIKFTGTYIESRLRVDGAIINSPTTPLKNISNITNKYLPLGTTTINTDNIVIKNTPSTSGASGTFDLLSRNQTSGINEKVTMTGTANFLAKYGSSSSLSNSIIQDNGTNVAVGSIDTNAKFNVIAGSLTYSQLLSGVATNANAQGLASFITAGSGVTTSFKTFRSVFSTSVAAFTLPRVDHYSVEQGAIGAGSTVTEQNGFTVASSMVGAGTNYGFRGSLPAGATNWNTYMSGTAKNHFNGSVLIGTITDNGIDKLQVTGTASGTVDATLNNQFVRYGQVSSLIGNTSGTYIPTAVAGTNVTSVATPPIHTYTKIGNIVTVYGYTLPTLTNTAIDSNYTITLPVARANTGTSVLGFGVTDSPTNTTKSVFINSSSTTTATIMLTSTLTGGVTCRYSFQYDVTQ